MDLSGSTDMVEIPSPVRVGVGELSTAAQQAGLSQDFINCISQYVSEGNMGLQHSDCLTIHESACSWCQYYPVLSFLVSGHLISTVFYACVSL